MLIIFPPSEKIDVCAIDKSAHSKSAKSANLCRARSFRLFKRSPLDYSTVERVIEPAALRMFNNGSVSEYDQNIRKSFHLSLASGMRH